jgi:hypothetical protein
MHSTKVISAILFQISVLTGMLAVSGCTERAAENHYNNYSGIYPHLAWYNNEGECGTGAVVPFADRLWVVTYGPHLPFGSSDKLYEISPQLERIVHPESIGGTPANRMIHIESQQLFIGPYVIDKDRKVRVILPQQMPGRLTGNARHLTDPANKIYTASMEEGFYEIDVNTLAVKPLYRDGNLRPEHKDLPSYSTPLASLQGAHGKGLYSGQGVLVYSNNGELSEEASSRFDIESGSLSEWNGKDWKLVRRNQFVEVTGPGGIMGNKDPDNDPIWVTGWDHKSLIAGVRDNGRWNFYRLPKASHSYDGAHGWNTEWPRIRDIGAPGDPDYLMTMHGMFWKFPSGFSSVNSIGIRPLSAYLKVIGDFARWNDSLVFGCDDSANKEFLNKRKVKGELEGPGQSNSNLWFTSIETPGLLGPNTAEGAVWLSEATDANEASEPFLFAGWENRICWLKNESGSTVNFSFEIDIDGNNEWKNLKSVPVEAGVSVNVAFDKADRGEWIRVKTDKPAKATAYFWYTATDSRTSASDHIFDGLANVSEPSSVGALLWGLDRGRHRLGVVAGVSGNEEFKVSGYYELDSLMKLVKTDDSETMERIVTKVAIPKNSISSDSASVVIDDDKGRRWRLPKGDDAFRSLEENSLLRICREVATERDLFNCSGTFYELPAENADGFAKIRPIASHSFRIHDYASYRGLLVMTGLETEGGSNNSHIIRSDDGKAAIWAGTIDDLWKLGKPVGEGGPWLNTKVKKGENSDPYLIGFYDKRTLSLSHNSVENVIFTIEADPAGNGHWMKYQSIAVAPGEINTRILPETFQARWIRFSADKECMATAILKYE